MSHDPFRSLRLRWDRLQDPAASPGRLRTPSRDALVVSGSPRFLGRITSSGTPPAQTDRVFLVHPVQLDGVETERGIAEARVDTSRTIPVVIVGGTVPRIGDLVVASSIGGRWVASLPSAPRETINCDGCQTPRRDLTLTITSQIAGPRSFRMTYNGLDEWASGCVEQMLFRLHCRNDVATFSVTHHVGGSCNVGTPSSCSSPGQFPFALTMLSRSCSPFLIQFNAVVCQPLAVQGYLTFTLSV